MRIAHVLNGPCKSEAANGVTKTVYFLSVTQAAMKHDVAVFSITSGTALPIRGVHTRSCAPSRFPFHIPAELGAELDAWQPDVVHLHSVYVPANAALARRLGRAGIPYVVTPNGGLSPRVMRRRPYLKWPYKLLAERPLLNGAAFVHAVADRDDIRRYGVRAPIVTAPNAMDLALVPAAGDAAFLARRRPELTGKKAFAFIGRLDPDHKGLDLLLTAFSRALAAVRDVVLVLVGPDFRGGERRLKRLAATLGLGPHVLFWGPAYGREKFDLLHASTAFVHTSRWEGLPFAVLEALACGKPCLVTRAADPLGLVGEWGAGIVVEPTIEDIATGLVRLASDSPAVARARGERGRRLVEQEFTWTRTAEILQDAYVKYARCTS